MYLLFLVISIVELVIQIFLLVNVRRKGLKKDWHNFLGTNIAVLISNFIIYGLFANSALGLSSALSSIIVCGFALISNLLLLIISFFIKPKIKKDKKHYFGMGIIILVLNLLIMITVPMIINRITIGKGKNYVIDYLNNKYGKANYEVLNVYEHYNDSGMWDKYLSNYYYELKCDYMEESFIIMVDNDFNYIESDFFLPVYYSEQLDLQYTLNYNDWDLGIEYNFDEFDEYVYNQLDDKNINVEYIYTDYVKSWNNIDGVEYNVENAIYGEVPSIEEIIKKLK